MSAIIIPFPQHLRGVPEGVVMFPSTAWRDRVLTALDIRLLGNVARDDPYGRSKRGCILTDAELAQILECSLERVQRSIARLQDREHIRITFHRRRVRRRSLRLEIESDRWWFEL